MPRGIVVDLEYRSISDVSTRVDQEIGETTSIRLQKRAQDGVLEVVKLSTRPWRKAVRRTITGNTPEYWSNKKITGLKNTSTIKSPAIGRSPSISQIVILTDLKPRQSATMAVV